MLEKSNAISNYSSKHMQVSIVLYFLYIVGCHSVKKHRIIHIIKIYVFISKTSFLLTLITVGRGLRNVWADGEGMLGDLPHIVKMRGWWSYTYWYM